MNLALLLARRFRRSRQKTGYLSFISASSTVGIGLGCAILIVLLSVMNGFQKVLEEDFLSMVPHVEYEAVNGALDDWERAANAVLQHPQVVAAAPVTRFQGMVRQPGRFRGLDIRAILPEQEASVSRITEFISKEQWLTFTETERSVIIGSGIATELGIEPGDRLDLLIPEQGQAGRISRSPQRYSVTVAGVFRMGGELDYQQAYMHLEDAAQALGFSDDEAASAIRLRVTDIFAAPQIATEASRLIREHAYIHDWTRTEGHLYRDIQLVRTVMYLVLILVLAVAAFNIVSTLVMAVEEKRSAIAILKTMGATDALIMKTFVWQGSFNGLIGATAGCLAGIAAAHGLPGFLRWIEQATGATLLAEDIYFVGQIPTQVAAADVALVFCAAVVTSLLATLWPSWQAAKMQPAVALK